MIDQIAIIIKSHERVLNRIESLIKIDEARLQQRIYWQKQAKRMALRYGEPWVITSTGWVGPESVAVEWKADIVYVVGGTDE